MSKDKGRYTLPSRTAPLKLFFSYSHRDERLRDQLADHLAALEREGLIAGWHDRRIGAGEDWAGAIDHHLSTADLILLLVSRSFVSSRYCYDLEMQCALERDAAGEARVIPVILRPVDWTSLPFSKLQALPRSGKPVTSWRNRDEAFLNIAQGIRGVADELRQPWKKEPVELAKPAPHEPACPRNEEGPVELDDTASLLLLKLNHVRTELAVLEILSDDPMKKVRLHTEIDRLRRLYRSHYGKDLPDDI